MSWRLQYGIILLTALICVELYPDPICWFLGLGVSGGVGLYSAMRIRERRKEKNK